MFSKQVLIYPQSRAHLPFSSYVQPWLLAPGSLFCWLCKIWHWLNLSCIPSFQIPETEASGSLYQLLSVCQGEKTRRLFTKNKIFYRAHRVKFSTYFCPEGTLRKGLCQFCFTASKWLFELWFHGNLGVPKPQDWAGSWSSLKTVLKNFPLM